MVRFFVMILFLFAFDGADVLYAQCEAKFSFVQENEIVKFRNLSEAKIANYYWDFGDGSPGSNFKHPVHQYPDNGLYTVSLTMYDGMGICTSFFETKIKVKKRSDSICNPEMELVHNGTSGDYDIELFDKSSPCEGYYPYADFTVGGDGLFQNRHTVANLGKRGFKVFRLILSDGLAYREAYETVPYNYDRSKNYSTCSPDFEVHLLERDSFGQRLLFKAMDKESRGFRDYRWEIIGFGNPLIFNKDTVSVYYPYSSADNWTKLTMVSLSVAGCNDTLYKGINIHPNIYTWDNQEYEKEDFFAIYPNPFRDQAVLDFHPQAEGATFELFNSSGQRVYSVSNITKGNLIIERGQMASGVYFYRLYTSGKTIKNGKIVMQ